jgi:hypothetical protein
MGTALGDRRGGVPVVWAQARSSPPADASRGCRFRGCGSISPASSPPHSRPGTVALGRAPRAPQPGNTRVPRGPARLAHGRALACVCPGVESGGGAVGLVQGRRRRQSLPGLSRPDRSRARGGPQTTASQARSAPRIPLQGGPFYLTRWLPYYARISSRAVLAKAFDEPLNGGLGRPETSTRDFGRRLLDARERRTSWNASLDGAFGVEGERTVMSSAGRFRMRS